MGNPASQETLVRIYNNTGANFKICTSVLCNAIPKLEKLISVDISQISNDRERALTELHIVIAQLNSFYNLVMLDLSAAWRASHRSSSNIEKRNNLKYFTVITIEGYRYLFGIDRKYALWNRLRALTEQLNETDLMKDVEHLKRISLEFKKSFNKSTDGIARNFSVHYNEDPIKVYDYLSSIVDEDIEAQRMSSFLSILSELSSIIVKYQERFSFDLFTDKDPRDVEIKELINVFPDKDNKVLKMMTSSIPLYGSSLDKIIKLCNMPKRLIEHDRFSHIDISQISKIAETSYPIIQVYFIYLDLACSIKAFLSSEHYLEKQLHLRRINVILYEGFNNIYGFDKEQRDSTFWQKYISHNFDISTNKDVFEKMHELERKLDKLATNSFLKRDDIREVSVHYRYKDKDNLVQLFKFAIDTHPMLELTTSLAILKILPGIMQLNKLAMESAYTKYKEKVDKPRMQLLDKMDITIETIRKSNSSEQQKQQLLDMIFKVRRLAEDPIKALDEYRKNKS